MRLLVFTLALTGTCFASSAASLQLEGELFHPFTNAEIVWGITNAVPKELWVYQVMPGAFSSGVVSNAMALGDFSMRDISKSSDGVLQDKHLIHFENKNEFGRRRWLYIAPSLGTMKYLSERGAVDAGEDVPSGDQAEMLARDILFRLGIDRSLLSDRVRQGYDETSTKVDRNGKPLGPDRVVSRGVSFERKIDGMPLSESWCFLAHFGSHGRLEDFTLRWRNVLPGEIHRLLPPAQIVQAIRSGQAVFPSQYRDVGGVKSATKLKITRMKLCYFDGTGREPLDFLVPYAEMEITAQDESNHASAVLQSPLLADTKESDRSFTQDMATTGGRALIPKEGADVLEKASSLTLLSLDPSPAAKSTNTFNGYPVLGKVEIKSENDRQKLLATLYHGVSMDGPQALCFNPRHGVHAQVGDKVEDLVICFECGQIYFHGISEGKLSIDGSAAPSLNAILSTAHIPISN